MTREELKKTLVLICTYQSMSPKQRADRMFGFIQEVMQVEDKPYSYWNDLFEEMIDECTKEQEGKLHEQTG